MRGHAWMPYMFRETEHERYGRERERVLCPWTWPDAKDMFRDQTEHVRLIGRETMGCRCAHMLVDVHEFSSLTLIFPYNNPQGIGFCLKTKILLDD